MRVYECSFCGSPIHPGHGMTFVRNDAKVFRFCRPRCQVHFKAKRNPRRVRWTRSFRRAAGKDMTVDTTFEFSRRRDVPVKYNRDLMQATLRAMDRVGEIQEKRERMHRERRKRQGSARQRLHDRVTIAQNLALADPADRERIAAAMAEVEERTREVAEEAADDGAGAPARRKSAATKKAKPATAAAAAAAAATTAEAEEE